MSGSAPALSKQQILATSRDAQREADDAVILNFGPDYFNGARYGSGFGSLFSCFVARSLYGRLRNGHILYDAHMGIRNPRTKWQFVATIRRGLQTNSFLTAGIFASTVTSILKAVKFALSSHRVNEFLLDDLEFGELQAWAQADPQVAAAFEKYCSEIVEQKMVTHGTLAELHQRDSSVVGKLLAMGNRDSKREEQVGNGDGDVVVKRHPTFWDGVSVGLFGSVMDCYLPDKKVSAYYGMAAGFGYSM